LYYRILNEDGKKALLEVELQTGKFHQIRAQLAAMGTPIIGDDKYGAAHFTYADKGIALHAYKLSFQDPIDGAPILLHANTPALSIWKW
jgi:23S rRNA pseudouridine1911/1915/1917 synthase